MGAAGPIGVAVAILFFGSNFVPVKRFDYGDGLSFQFVMCIGVWFVGLMVQMIRGNPAFEPYAMLGGVMWATGNLTVVPILRRIGLAMGMLVWGGMNLVTGWSSGVFGFMGIDRQTSEVESWGLNITGVVLAMAALAVSSLIRPETQGSPPRAQQQLPIAPIPVTGAPATPPSDPGAGLLNLQQVPYEPLPPSPKDVDPEAALPNAAPAAPGSELRNRIEGVLMSLVAGVLYGCSFNPSQSLIDNPGEGDSAHSTNSLDYVFSHYSGILLAGIVYFVAYLLYKSYKGEAPYINAEGSLGALISGAMWGIAQAGFFMANGALSFVVTFPLIAVGPGFLACLWGVFLFGEITGRRNYYLLLACGTLIVSCAVCIMFSR